jgi:hypothetical protein
VKIIISSNPEALKSENPSHTVEAEYGDVCVEGSILTLAHHGPRSNNPAPCNAEIPDKALVGPMDDAVIGLSHVDLDTLGGVAAILRNKPDAPLFWRVAEQVDLRGAHCLETILSEQEADYPGLGHQVEEQLFAWWAHSEQNKIWPPRDGSVADVTSEVRELISTIKLILDDDQDLIAEGELWKQEQQALDKDSFVERIGSVVLRSSEQFVNHLYGGADVKAAVAFNPKNGSVTVSLANPIDGVSCCELVQELWGPEAGGHAGIAGSPRDSELAAGDARKAALELASRLG